MKTVLQCTHLLDEMGVDQISEEISAALSAYPHLSRREILRLRLSAEEILLHWRQEAGAQQVQLVIEEKGYRIELMLVLDGISYQLSPPPWRRCTDTRTGLAGWIR